MVPLGPEEEIRFVRLTWRGADRFPGAKPGMRVPVIREREGEIDVQGRSGAVWPLRLGDYD